MSAAALLEQIRKEPPTVKDEILNALLDERATAPVRRPVVHEVRPDGSLTPEHNAELLRRTANLDDSLELDEMLELVFESRAARQKTGSR